MQRIFWLSAMNFLIIINSLTVSDMDYVFIIYLEDILEKKKVIWNLKSN